MMPRHSLLYPSIVLLLGVLLLLPVLATPLPPLVDYPAHIARIHILKTYEASEHLQRFYLVDWAWQPNLAFDIVARFLLPGLDGVQSGRVFLGLAVLLNLAGVLLAHRALHGQLSLFPLLAALFVYNRILLGGLVNYLFALGLAFVFFAAWLQARRQPWPRPFLVLAGSAAALILYLGHLTAFGVFALLVGGYEIDAFFRDRVAPWHRRVLRLVTAGLPFVPPIAVFLFLSASSQHPTSTRFGSLAQKLTAPMNLFYNYDLAFDVAGLGLVILVVAGGLALGLVHIAPRMLLPTGLLALAFLVTPNVMFDSHGADRRLTIAVAYALLCALDWAPPLRRAQVLATAALLTLFAARIGVITQNWRASQEVYAEYLAALDRLPPGARLAIVVGHPYAETVVHPPVNLLGTLAIIRRDAFVPNLWANPAQQPVVMQPEFRALASSHGSSLIMPPDLARIAADPGYGARVDPYAPARLAGYDHVLVSRPAGLPFAPPAGRLQEIARGTEFRLFAVRPPG